MKRIGALFLVVCLLLAIMSGCGGQKAESSAPPASSSIETPEESIPPTTPPAESEPASDQELSSEETPVLPSVTIEYPIPGEHTLTMIQCMRNHAAAVLGDGDFSDQYVYPELVRRTGVNLEFDMIAETALSEKLNLIIVSNDYPDIFGQGIGNYDSNPAKAITDDVVMDLTDLLADNAPNYNALLESNPDFHQAVYNSDGTVCKITSSNIGLQSQGLFIRKDWLDALGLEVPTTVDELTNVLTEFHKAYNTPMTLMVNADLDDGLASVFDHSMVGFTRQMLGFQQTEPNSGKLICAMASDGYFEHMTLLRQYYADGLINGDFLSISKENGNFESTYYDGQCGIWQEGCEVADDSYRENFSDSNAVAMPMLSPTNNGEATHMSSFTSVMTGMFAVYISATCQQPEIALQFLNYGYTDEGKDLIAFGIEGETFTRDADGKVSYTELLTEFPDGIRAAEWYYLVNSWMPTEQQLASVYMKYSDKAIQACEMWTEAAKEADDSMAVPMQVQMALNTEEMDIVTQHCGDLCTHFSMYTGNYIMGAIGEAEFKQAVADADKIGLQEVTAAYQSAYDRYMEENSDA